MAPPASASVPEVFDDLALPSLADVGLLREPPVTARGVRTRDALITAARQVFERDGLIDAKLTDIPKQAKCSTGTFYNYFADKEEILHAVLASVQDDMLHPGVGNHVVKDAMPYQIIEAGNRAYLEAYRRNARLMMVLDQAASVDPRLRRARLNRNRAFVERNARYIVHLQDRGEADSTLDPYLTSRALSAMVSRVAYVTFCLEDDPVNLDELTDTLTRLWANALRLSQ